MTQKQKKIFTKKKKKKKKKKGKKKKLLDSAEHKQTKSKISEESKDAKAFLSFADQSKVAHVDIFLKM